MTNLHQIFFNMRSHSTYNEAKTNLHQDVISIKLQNFVTANIKCFTVLYFAIFSLNLLFSDLFFYKTGTKP